MSSWYTRAFTPWVRAAIQAGGIEPESIRRRIPEGWAVGGHAGTSRGPYHLKALGPDRLVTVTAQRYWEVPEALDRLFAQMPPVLTLEEQLAASLRARGQ